CLSLGMTPTEMLLSAVGAAEDPNSGGRQMPSHWGHKALNIVSQSSPTGTQLLQAVGCAEAWLRYTRIDAIAEKPVHGDELVYVSAGDGTTSEGEFWEALNTASNLKLPVLFLIEDNSYAISVPVEVQTAGGSISRLVRSFPGLLVEEVDGCDPIASHVGLGRAIDRLRSPDGGPALVHARTIRHYSHSLSDDERLYKTDTEREEEAGRDPIPAFGRLLVRNRVADEGFLQAMREEIDREVDEAAQSALAAPKPDPTTITRHVYSEEVDPASDRFDVKPSLAGEPRTMVDLLNDCLRDEMDRNDRIVVFGEDVADCSRADHLAKVK